MAMLGIQDRHKVIIGAIALPPFPGTPGRESWCLEDIERFAVDNALVFEDGGVDAIVVSTLGDALSTNGVPPETIAYMTSIGRAVRREFNGPLGILLHSHSGDAPIAIAAAVGADFVRLKVYVGAVVKAEGILYGCAGQALACRDRLGAHHVKILADVYDRTGVPIGETTLGEAADWAVRFCRADGLVLTGRTFAQSMEYLAHVREQNIGVPLFLGGGATAENVAQALQLADGIIVNTSVQRRGGTAEERAKFPWDIERIKEFMVSVRAATHNTC